LEKKREAVKPLSRNLATGSNDASGRKRAIWQYGDVEGDDSTDFCKILEFHETVTTLVVVPEYFEYLGLLHVETERTHRDFELMVVQGTILVCVEELKGFLYFLFLFVRELWTCMCPSLGFLCRSGVHRKGGSVDSAWFFESFLAWSRGHSKRV
jgi:hypothetical protein